jgi:site-specific recombinase XerC
MNTSSQFNPGMPSMEQLGQFGEQILEANREAARLCLDAYEKALEQIASYQEQAASQTDVEWIATAAMTQARLTREMAKRQVSVGREFLNT